LLNPSEPPLFYTGYLLTLASRAELLAAFPPIYERVIAEHVTVAFDVDALTPAPPAPQAVEVVGYIDSGDGIQAVLVAVDGETFRPDGKLYHITLSLGDGRYAAESNKYMPWAEPTHALPLTVSPKLFAC
jgi:hypothetical protein